MKTLKERLKDWTDADLAMYELTTVLGMTPEFGTEPGKDPWNNLKYIFWSANPTNEMLFHLLESLVQIGVLEMSDEPQFRWNQNYVLT